MLFTTNQNRQNVVENILTLIYTYRSRRLIKKSFFPILKVYRSTIAIVYIMSNNSMIRSIECK